MRTFLLLTLLLPFAAGAELHHVEINAMKFSPPDLKVHVGDEVVWENKDLVPHTVSADNGAFDSGQIDSGKSYKTKIKKRGRIAYKCKFHPTMTAQLEATTSSSRAHPAPAESAP
jgi:plastocyanin